MRLGVVALATVMVLLVACGGGTTTRVHRPGEEYLAAIQIEGNNAIADDDLIPGLGLHRNAERERSVDDYQLQLDGQRIAATYQKIGYFAVDVSSRIITGRRGHRGVHGRRGAAGDDQVEITGLPPEVPLDKARKLVAIADGAPFDYDAFDDAKDPMQRLVEDAGYAHVAVESR